VVENFRPGTMEAWGMGYDALSALNPGLVMARVSGFGQTGPYSHRAGYALVGEAMGGLRHITGEPDRNPARAGISIGDSLSGLNTALGVMMAVHARQRTGRGQVVDTAIYESVLTVMENLITEYDLTGYVRERSGAVLPGIAPSNVYPTKSGELILIGANQDTLFKRLCDLMGRPDLADDVRYRDHAARGAHQGELDARIAAWTADHEIEALLPLLEKAGIATGRIYRAPDMLTDPQFVARESIVSVPHPVFGQVKMQNAFPRLSETPGEVRWVGPTLGEHTDAVLRDVAGLSDEAIAGLRARKVL
jgi:formyl-CoA transferase